jgi:transposase
MKQEVRHEIVRRWREGQSLRGIARDLNAARKTVRRVILSHRQQREEGHVQPELTLRKKRRSQLDEFEDALRELLTRYPKITVTRLLEELRRRGYRGGYTMLRQRVSRLRPRKSSPFVERFETAPAQQAQMDYGVYDLDFTQEGRRRVHLFGYILGYSRRQYLHFVESQDMDTTLREHVCAFEHLKGVAATCLYDNMKVVVARYEDEEPIYNTRFLAFATHYGYRPVACRPQRPQTKGKIERQFDYVEKNLLNGRTFRSLAHLNEVTAWWLAEVADVRVHRTTRQRPIDLHVQEQPHLIPLPAARYEVAEVVYRTVDHEGYVCYGQNRYSVPWEKTHPGQVLPVKITEHEVIIYSLQLCELTRHVRFDASITHQKRQHREHHPPRDVESRRQQARQQFQQLGESAVAFLEGLLRCQRRGWEQARKVLACLRNYRREDLLAALERARRFGAFSLDAVERILAVQARPKTSYEHLADQARDHLRQLFGADPTPPRSAAEYQQFLFDEPSPAKEEPEEPTRGQTPEEGQPEDDQSDADQPGE